MCTSNHIQYSGDPVKACGMCGGKRNANVVLAGKYGEIKPPGRPVNTQECNTEIDVKSVG